MAIENFTSAQGAENPDDLNMSNFIFREVENV